MKQRENEIESQRGVDVTDRQVIARPCAEKNEYRESCQSLNSRERSFDQRQCQQANVDDEQISEQNRRPMRDCMETKQVKRREHRAREKCRVRFSGALCPCGRGQE